MRGVGRARGWRLAAAAAAVASLVAPAARAEDVTPTGHAAYGIGGALGTYSGFRQNLDVGLGVAYGTTSHSNVGGGGFSGMFADAWMATGFGAYPTYLGLGGGIQGVGLISASFSAGPALRLGAAKGGGGEVRGTASLLGVQAGLRLIVVGGHGADAQLCFTAGYGFD